MDGRGSDVQELGGCVHSQVHTEAGSGDISSEEEVVALVDRAGVRSWLRCIGCGGAQRCYGEGK